MVTIDAKFGDAYLQLGNLEYSRHDLQKAIDSYTKAIEVKPELVGCSLSACDSLRSDRGEGKGQAAVPVT